MLASPLARTALLIPLVFGVAHGTTPTPPHPAHLPTLDLFISTTEVVVVNLPARRGSEAADPVPAAWERISVYARCAGVGSITVSIAGMGSFETACSLDPKDVGIQNSLDARFVDELALRVDGNPSLTWAVAVTIPR